MIFHTRLLTLLTLTVILNLTPAMAINSTADLHQDHLPAGLSSQIDFSLAGAQGNVDKYDATFSLDLFHQNQSRTWAMLLVAARSEAANQLTTDSLFNHIRLFLPKDVESDFELYLQLSQDEFARLEYRGLFGGGVRWRHLLNETQSQIFGGSGLMYEREKISEQNSLPSEIDEHLRLNLYAIFRYPIESHAQFKMYAYMQPRLDVPSDVRAQLESEISFVLSKRTDVSLSIKLSHDSQPPEDVDHTDFSYTSGISINF